MLILLSCNLTHKSLELKTIPVKLNIVTFVVTLKISVILKVAELARPRKKHPWFLCFQKFVYYFL